MEERPYPARTKLLSLSLSFVCPYLCLMPDMAPHLTLLPQCKCKLLISAVSAWHSAHTGLLVCCIKSLIITVRRIRLVLAHGAQQITANQFAGKTGLGPRLCT